MNINTPSIDLELVKNLKIKWRSKINKNRSSPIDRKSFIHVTDKVFKLRREQPPVITFTKSPLGNFFAIKAMIEMGFGHMENFMRLPQIDTALKELIGKGGLHERLYNSTISGLYQYLERVFEDILSPDHDRISELFSSELFTYYLELMDSIDNTTDLPADMGTPDYFNEKVIRSSISAINTIDHKFINSFEFTDRKNNWISTALNSTIQFMRSNSIDVCPRYEYLLQSGAVTDEGTRNDMEKFIKYVQTTVLNIQAVYDKETNQQYWFVSENPIKASYDSSGRWHHTQDIAVEFEDGWKAYFVHGSYFNKFQFDKYVLNKSLTMDRVHRMEFERNDDYIVGALYELYYDGTDRPDQFPVTEWYNDSQPGYYYYDDD